MITASRQSGNVIMIVLIGIVLFSALTYAVTRSMNGGGDFGNREKMSAQVTQILNYGNVLRDTVKVLSANGCAENQISFESPLVPTGGGGGYVNASAPSDKSCHVFETAGGGLTFRQVDQKLKDPAFSSASWQFSGSRSVMGIGTANAELIAYARFISKDVCQAINSSLGISQAGQDVPQNSMSTEDFSGTYTNGDKIGYLATSTALNNQSTGCLQSTTGGTTGAYIYYVVLLPR